MVILDSQNKKYKLIMGARKEIHSCHNSQKIWQVTSKSILIKIYAKSFGKNCI